MYLNTYTTSVQWRLVRRLDYTVITLVQFGVLAHLQAAHHISQLELADWLFVTKGNIVGVLNRLEDRGFVERRPDPEDGRMHMVSLTEQGAALAARVVPEHEELVAVCMGVIAPEEQHTLHQLDHLCHRDAA